MKLTELDEAKRITDAWEQCVPAKTALHSTSDILHATQVGKRRLLLELEAQMLVNGSEDNHEALRIYFTQFGILVSKRKKVKEKRKWKNSTKVFFLCTMSIVLLALTLLYFSEGHTWIYPSVVVIVGIFALVILTFAYLSGNLVSNSFSGHCHHYHH